MTGPRDARADVGTRGGGPPSTPGAGDPVVTLARSPTVARIKGSGTRGRALACQALSTTNCSRTTHGPQFIVQTRSGRYFTSSLNSHTVVAYGTLSHQHICLDAVYKRHHVFKFMRNVSPRGGSIKSSQQSALTFCQYKARGTPCRRI